MLGPFTKLVGPKVLLACHTLGQDSVRLELEHGVVFIAYNDCVLDGANISISNNSDEFNALVGTSIETIRNTDEAVNLSFSGQHSLSIGLRDRDRQGPEAYQILIPGFVPVVEQNP
jgi:hypothetical protein